MPKPCPKSILILHDDYYAKFMGRTKDGRQFFLTTPFVPGGHDFVALYTFDAAGNFLEAVIDVLGTRAQADLLEQRLADLGEKKFCDIRIQPFEVERFGVKFGLIPRPPEEPDDSWWLIFLPGDFMAFTEPWDGTYDT